MTPTTSVHPSQSTPSERVEKRAQTVSPLVDVFENANEILLVADVPGAARDGVDVQIEKGHLSVYARRARSENEKLGSARHVEQRAYDYHRVFTVPTTIDATKIEAELKDGVLKVRLPKAEALKPRRIEVKVS